MEALVQLVKRFSELNREKILGNVYTNKLQKDLIDLNTKDQLYDQGIDSNSHVLPEYTANTKQIKRAKGQPVDRTTLKDTGEFYESFKIIVGEDYNFQITADDQGKLLFDRYGKDIVGWTKDNTEKIKKEIGEKFIDETKKFLFKK